MTLRHRFSRRRPDPYLRRLGELYPRVEWDQPFIVGGERLACRVCIERTHPQPSEVVAFADRRGFDLHWRTEHA